MTSRRICWMLSSAGEASIAVPASRVLEERGIETVFASWLTEGWRCLRSSGIDDANYVPGLLPDALAVQPADLDESDRRYSPPGLASLLHSEARARYLKDSSGLLVPALRYLAFWEDFLVLHEIDAVVMWQSTDLPCRTMWAVAHALGLEHLILVKGPSFDRVAFADVSERAIWSELLERVENPGQKEITSEEREAALQLVAGITDTHARFRSRPTSKILPLIRCASRAKRWLLRLMETVGSRGLRRIVLVEDRVGSREELEERRFLRRARRMSGKRRTIWDWQQTLGLVRYDKEDWGEKYVYFPLQFEVDVNISTRNPLFNDQLELARAIARAVPPGYRLYVKEHPNQPGMYSRSNLNRLRSLPNVSLLHPKTDRVRLIRSAKSIVVVNSTTGWEAFLWKVPVVVLGRPFYSYTDLVQRVDRLDELPAKLRIALDAGSAMYQAREQDWLWFIWQTIDTTHPGSPFGYKKIYGTLEERSASGNGRLVGTALAAKLTTELGRSQDQPDRLRHQ